MWFFNIMNVAIIKEIPVPKDSHPTPKYLALPKHEFSMGLVAAKGSGKTTLICNLLDFYKGYFHTIMVFSPTVDNDEKWDYVKKQKLLIENVELKRWIRDNSVRSKGQVIEGPPRGAEFDGLVDPKHDVFDAKIPKECFFTEYSESDLVTILAEQNNVIKLLKKHKKSKYLANRILFIFDDLVGSNLFSQDRKNPFKIFNTRHRHYSASIIVVTQGYKEIPKTVRTNWSCLVLFETANEKELEVIYEEFTMGLKRLKWDEIYRFATSGNHDFLYFNYQKPKGERVMRNFEEVLLIKEEHQSTASTANL